MCDLVHIVFKKKEKPKLIQSVHRNVCGRDCESSQLRRTVRC